MLIHQFRKKTQKVYSFIEGERSVHVTNGLMSRDIFKKSPEGVACGASEGLGADFTSTTRMLKPAIVSKVVADSNYTWDGGLMWIDSDIGEKIAVFRLFLSSQKVKS